MSDCVKGIVLPLEIEKSIPPSFLFQLAVFFLFWEVFTLEKAKPQGHCKSVAQIKRNMFNLS